ncbi:MAG: hypothetical protein M1357_02055 [Candidatus Marsarchaeota archaeon]|nr:hypothetical protein [Candidatus Marsarchaeota archaeon]
MAGKRLVEVVLGVAAFVPFAVALGYYRIHRATPSFYLSLGLFVFYALIVGAMVFAQRRYKAFSDD